MSLCKNMLSKTLTLVRLSSMASKISPLMHRDLLSSYRTLPKSQQALMLLLSSTLIKQYVFHHDNLSSRLITSEQFAQAQQLALNTLNDKLNANSPSPTVAAPLSAVLQNLQIAVTVSVLIHMAKRFYLTRFIEPFHPTLRSSSYRTDTNTSSGNQHKRHPEPPQHTHHHLEQPTRRSQRPEHSQWTYSDPRPDYWKLVPSRQQPSRQWWTH